MIASSLNFALANVRRVKKQMTIQVTFLNKIEIDQGEATYSGASQVFSDNNANAAHSKN
jgi:hypothetical protein